MGSENQSRQNWQEYVPGEYRTMAENDQKADRKNKMHSRSENNASHSEAEKPVVRLAEADTKEDASLGFGLPSIYQGVATKASPSSLTAAAFFTLALFACLVARLWRRVSTLEEPLL